MPVRSRLADISALVLFLALCLGIGALGASVVATSVDTWYAGLVKPSFNPPDEVFGPVWTADGRGVSGAAPTATPRADP